MTDEQQRCLHCDYPLHGINSAVCPECGWQINHDDIRRVTRERLSWNVRVIQGSIVLGAVHGVAALIMHLPDLIAQIRAGMGLDRRSIVGAVVIPAVSFGLLALWKLRRERVVVLGWDTQAAIMVMVWGWLAISLVLAAVR